MKHSSAMIKILTDPKAKSNAFTKHYTNVSKLAISKEDRHLNLSSSVGDESCTAFTMAVPKNDFAKMKLKGAAGPDEIPPMFLNSLGSHTRNEPIILARRLSKNIDIIPLLKSRETGK